MNTTRSQDSMEHFDRAEGLAALWFGLLAGPAAWFVHLNVSYSLVRLICRGGESWLLHLATLATLVLAGAGVWMAWSTWRRIGEPAVTNGGGTAGRTRFMALSGIALSGFFFGVILLASIPGFLLHPCAEL